MVCERPPAAFGGSPPHEGEINACNVRGFILPLVRGRRERSERGGRSHTILNRPRYPARKRSAKLNGSELSPAKIAAAGSDKEKSESARMAFSLARTAAARFSPSSF